MLEPIIFRFIIKEESDKIKTCKDDGAISTPEEKVDQEIQQTHDRQKKVISAGPAAAHF